MKDFAAIGGAHSPPRTDDAGRCNGNEGSTRFTSTTRSGDAVPEQAADLVMDDGSLHVGNVVEDKDDLPGELRQADLDLAVQFRVHVPDRSQRGERAVCRDSAAGPESDQYIGPENVRPGPPVTRVTGPLVPRSSAFSNALVEDVAFTCSR
jgi:hypothetical protein